MKDIKLAKKSYFHGRYMIALYDIETDEYCYGVFRNVNEIALCSGHTAKNISSALSRIFNHTGKKQEAISMPMGKARPHLIRMTQKEMMEDMR